MEADAVRYWPGLRSAYAWLPPHEDVSVTGPNQIGVSFSGHRAVAYRSDSRADRADIPPGSTVVSGGSPIDWLGVREPTEAMEIYPEPAFVDSVAAPLTSQRIDVRRSVGRYDGTVLAVAAVLRRAHVTSAGISDVVSSTLAHRLVLHLIERYAGVRVDRSRPGRLAPTAVDRVTEAVEAKLHSTLTLDDLAETVRLSPYHFSRAFRMTTGLAPYEFVTIRRMDRARLLLNTTSAPVHEVAAQVGYANLSHFRRLFRHHHGMSPSATRR